jgi:hypothetical protein
MARNCSSLARSSAVIFCARRTARTRLDIISQASSASVTLMAMPVAAMRCSALRPNWAVKPSVVAWTGPVVVGHHQVFVGRQARPMLGRAGGAIQQCLGLLGTPS